MKIILSFILAFCSVASYGASQGVSFDSTTRNVAQTDLNLKVSTFTNTAATASSILGTDASKGQVSSTLTVAEANALHSNPPYVPGGTDVSVPDGGTGVSSLTPYAPIFGGTTSTGPMQSGTVGTSGQVLTSGGPGQIATFATMQQTNISGLMNFMYPQQFGMVGNGIFITNVFITASSSTLTCTNGWQPNAFGGATGFTSSDVGKTIHIYKAGPHGAGAMYDMVGTITAFTSTNQVTVSYNASITVAGGVSGSACYGTDDSAALQNAVNYGLRTNYNQSCLLLEPKIYMISGPFDGTRGAQIYTPDVTSGIYSPTLEIRGSSSESGLAFPAGAIQIPVGTTLYSAISNTTSAKSFFKIITAAGTINPCRVKFKDVTIRVPTNPQYTAIDATKAGAFQIENCIVWTGWASGGTPALPTMNSSYGVKMPGAGNYGGGWNRAEDLRIIGFYTCFSANEHTAGHNILTTDAVVGYEFSASPHPSSFGRIEAQFVVNTINVTGTTRTSIQQLDVEHESGTFARTADILDNSSFGRGDIRYGTVTGGVGSDSTFVVNGGTNFNLVDLNGTNYIQRQLVSTNYSNLISGTIWGTTTNVAKTSNYTLTTVDSGKWFNNNGAAGAVILTAPAATVGLRYILTIITAQTFEFLAVGTDTIRNAGSVGVAAGNLQANTIGNVVEIYCPVAGQWFCKSVNGTWTLN